MVRKRQGVEFVDLMHVVMLNGRLWLLAVDLHGLIARRGRRCDDAHLWGTAKKLHVRVEGLV